MNQKLNELFDIKTDNKNNSQSKEINYVKHSLTRVLILIIIVLAFLLLMNLPSTSMDDGVGFLFFAIFFPIIWLLYIFFETIIFHFKKKYILRNANIIMLFVIGIIFTLIISLMS